jgi:cell division protein ZapA
MGEKSVKITIAGRVYPIKVDAAEEAYVHDAAKRINERVDQLEQGFVVKDKQDLLALTALQFATQYLESQTNVIDDKDGLIASLVEVDELLDAHLAKSR